MFRNWLIGRSDGVGLESQRYGGDLREYQACLNTVLRRAANNRDPHILITNHVVHLEVAAVPVTRHYNLPCAEHFN